MPRMLEQGTVVKDRYRLERELGRGGMGRVWVAHDAALDTPCALKFIDLEAAKSAPLRNRFEREAKAAAQLRSAHVIQILDHGIWEGMPFIAMELLEGEDLGARLARLGTLPGDTARIVGDVARALTRAHAAGIVHRDLKPGNIFLVHDDDCEVAKVLDFGVAKTPSKRDELSKTRTGMLLGTPHYMSPEQADGTLPVDFRSDLWSLGVVAFQCVTGRLPFESEALGDLLNRIMNKPLPVPSRVHPGTAPQFDAWFRRACARPVDERFQSARELADALHVALAAASVAEPPATLAEPPAGADARPMNALASSGNRAREAASESVVERRGPGAAAAEPDEAISATFGDELGAPPTRSSSRTRILGVAALALVCASCAVGYVAARRHILLDASPPVSTGLAEPWQLTLRAPAARAEATVAASSITLAETTHSIPPEVAASSTKATEGTASAVRLLPARPAPARRQPSPAPRSSRADPGY